ncbi:MAG: hypothetical protein JO089_02515 [Alphaproteobacteria bacterium]|nr:hypothetical protein [Alphaproteobacteria bacterium]
MTSIDTFDMDRALPSHQQRLAEEKKVNVYFVPGADRNGNPNYVYAVCSSMLHEMFLHAVRDGNIPDFAVVVEMGGGEPSEAVKEKMLRYYGFDHAEAAGE